MAKQTSKAASKTTKAAKSSVDQTEGKKATSTKKKSTAKKPAAKKAAPKKPAAKKPAAKKPAAKKPAAKKAATQKKKIGKKAAEAKEQLTGNTVSADNVKETIDKMVSEQSAPNDELAAVRKEADDLGVNYGATQGVAEIRQLIDLFKKSSGATAPAPAAPAPVVEENAEQVEDEDLGEIDPRKSFQQTSPHEIAPHPTMGQMGMPPEGEAAPPPPVQQSDEQQVHLFGDSFVGTVNESFAARMHGGMPVAEVNQMILNAPSDFTVQLIDKGEEGYVLVVSKGDVSQEFSGIKVR